MKSQWSRERVINGVAHKSTCGLKKGGGGWGGACTWLVQVAIWATVQILLSIRSTVQSAPVVSLRAFASIILFLKKSLYVIIDLFSLCLFVHAATMRRSISPQHATVSWATRRQRAGC